MYHENRNSFLSLSPKGFASLKAAVCLALAATLGCSGGPSRVLPPEMSASAAGQQAMAEYDTDGDGLVAGSELEKAPGLKAAMRTLDKNGDGKVSADEVAARVTAWQATRVGIMPIMCYVMIDGKPLDGATVTFEPEKFLGSDIKQATGTSGYMGDFYPSITPPDSPDRDAPVGVQFGLYKVKVSKLVNGNESIPSRFNTETVLGQEVSNEDPGIARHKVIFNVKSK